jgi:LysW-gamma-L-lysine carboxypeptidase
MSDQNPGLVENGLALLQGLLEIRSPSGSEEAAVDYLTSWMRHRGFDASVDRAGNAVGILGAHGGGTADTRTREIMLLGHIDTVPGFPPVVCRDGKLYGRGAVDAKGPLAAFATAAALVGARPGWRIVVAGAVEEESATSKGARDIARHYLPDAVLIGEPTGWQKLAIGYKGRLLADLTVRRPMSHRAGPHASAPEMAISYWQAALERLGELNRGREKIWDQVQGTLRRFSSWDDGLEEIAHLQLGFRLPLHMSPQQLREHLGELADGHRLQFYGDETAFRAEKNTPLVRAFLAATRDQGGVPGFVVKTGTSDMNVVGPIWRCPMGAYGPGDSDLDHTPEEHVDLAEWRKGVAVLTGVLNRVTAGPV